MFSALETVKTKTGAMLTDAVGKRHEGLLGGPLFVTRWNVLISVPPGVAPVWKLRHHVVAVFAFRDLTKEG